MSTEYFSNFPVINYANSAARNIMLRAAMRDAVKDTASYYLPLTLETGERTDMIASDLYSDSGYDWIIKLCNNIVDPYYEWHITDDQLEAKIIKKYGSLEASMQANSYYVLASNTDIVINTDTYDLMTDGRELYYGVTYYDDEVAKNETKRNINVLAPQYTDKLANELEKKLNE